MIMAGCAGHTEQGNNLGPTGFVTVDELFLQAVDCFTVV